MTTPGTRNLDIYRGDTYFHYITFNDGSAPIDMSAGTWLAQIRPGLRAEVVATFTVDTTSAATGVIVLRLTPEQTAALTTHSSLNWDLQRTVDDNVETLLAGTVTTRGDVSRA